MNSFLSDLLQNLKGNRRLLAGGIAIGILCAYIIFSTLYQKHIESLQALSEREELYRTLSGSVISHA
ncbi:MAG: hypothetical protein ACHQYP_08655, partial [Nitrospiria bacterium]